MDFQRERGYRPQIVQAGKDDLITAGKQAHIDQQIEAATDTRDGERHDEIYAAATKFVDATEALGIKRRKTPEERELDIERMAFGIAMGINTPDRRLRRVGVERALNLLRPGATDSAKRKILMDVAKTFNQVQGLTKR